MSASMVVLVVTWPMWCGCLPARWRYLRRVAARRSGETSEDASTPRGRHLGQGGRQHGTHRGERSGVAEQVPLGDVVAELAEGRQLLGRLDPLADRDQAERVADLGHQG